MDPALHVMSFNLSSKWVNQYLPGVTENILLGIFLMDLSVFLVTCKANNLVYDVIF